MLNKLLLALAILCLHSTKSFAITQAEMPEQFTVTERLFSWTSSFDIETPQYRVGTVHRKFFSWKLEYDFFDVQEQLLAKARMRWLTFGAVFDVTDSSEQPIGMVEERVFTFFPTFDIFSPCGEKLATAQMNFWGTRYTLTDPITSQEIAVLSRPFFRLTSSWSVNIINPALFAEKNINPALFIIVMAFQTDREHWNRQADRDSNNNMNLSFESPYADAAKHIAMADMIIPSLRIQLETYRSQVEGIEPTDADLNAVENMIESVLTNAQREAKSNIEKVRLAYGLKQLMPLLTSVELKPGEKSGLFLMIDKTLCSIE